MLQVLVNMVTFGMVIAILGYGAKLFLNYCPLCKAFDNRLSGENSFAVIFPDILSFARIPAVGWMLYVMATPALHTRLWAYSIHVCFVLICIFDVLHDHLAERLPESIIVKRFWKYLDPATDRVVTFTLAWPALIYGELRWWVFAIFVLSEAAILFQRYRARRKGRIIRASWLDKLKTGIQYSVLYLLLLRIDLLPSCGIGLDELARMLPANSLLWGMTFLSFYTVIAVFPYFQTFFYVNDYERSQREDSNRPWYIVMIPNAFTLGNYLCGVTAVYFAMPEVEVAYRPFVVLFWVMAAALSDALDGPLARKLKAHSEFGACLDASTDLSTFGLAAGTAIFLQFSSIRGQASLWGLSIALFFFLFVHWRLARFSVLTKSSDPNVKSDFVGLPSPSGALGVLILFTLFQNLWIMSILVILISLLMYSNFDFISHSNSTRHPLYRYILIPWTFSGFVMLFLLVFQQPFISNHTSRELIEYFQFCSRILTIPLGIYIIHSFIRGPVKMEADDSDPESVEEVTS